MNHNVLRRTQSIIAAATLLAVAGPALADATSDRMADLERRLEYSLRLINDLSAEVKQLKTSGPREGTPTTDPAAMAVRVSGLEQQLSALGSRSTSEDGLALHGFADVGLQFNNRGEKRGANLGNFDIYLTPQFDRVKSLVELNFEVSDAGDVGTDLERLQLGYSFNDQLTVWAGRFHTPYGYWHNAFHHGAQMQTSILRPRFLDFEDKGGILPAHVVGLWGTGNVRAGAGRVTYDFYAVNSPRIGLTDPAVAGSGVLNPNQAGATSHQALVGLNVGYQFGGALRGLTFGVHGFKGRIADDAATGTNSTDVRMAGGYGLYLENNWEVMSEYYRFSNRDVSGGTGTHSSRAGYVQAGHNFSDLTPFARVEKTALDQTDNYFSQQASGQSYQRTAVGVRYDVNSKAALKLEINRTKFNDRVAQSFSEARAQYSIRF